MQIELKIGQAALLLGITPKTIRHYHKLGILPPPKRADNGYRVYSVQSLYRVNLIKSLKQIGLSLKDIKDIIEAENPDDALHQKLEAMVKTVQKQIIDLQTRQTIIQNLIGSEATLDETRQAEFPLTKAIMPDSFVQILEQVSPQLMVLEQGLYEQLDKFQWGADYEQFLKDIFRFLEARPEFVEYLTTTFEQAKHLAPEDTQLLSLAQDLAENLAGTPILALMEKSAFSQDKSLFQTFLLVSEDQLASGLNSGQKQLLELLEQVRKNQS